jgi:hypothetical protein
MWPFSHWTTAGRAALTYITIGALTVIWSGIWYAYLINNPPAETAYYWCTGFLMTGLTMVFIGLALGKINRSAQQADQPVEVPVAMVNLPPAAVTAPAPVLAPLNLTSPGVAPPGKVVLVPPGSQGV